MVFDNHLTAVRNLYHIVILILCRSELPLLEHYGVYEKLEIINGTIRHLKEMHRNRLYNAEEGYRNLQKESSQVENRDSVAVTRPQSSITN